MTRTTYKVMATLDPGGLLPKVQEVTDELNRHMSHFGFDEKVCLRSTTEIAELSINGELTPETEQKFREIMQSEFDEKLPRWKVQIGDFVKQ